MRKPTPFQKKDGNWYCNYQGKQHYLGKNYTEKLRRLVEGDCIKRSRALGDLITQYLQSIKEYQSQDTVRAKKSCYNQFQEAIGSETPIRLVTREIVEEYQRNLLVSGQKKTSVKSIRTKLSAFFQYCVERELIKENPVRQCTKIKLHDDPIPDHLTEEEAELLLELTEKQRYPSLQKRDKLVFLLMLNAGLRRIEVCQLKWSDIDFAKRILVVRNGKGGKHRMVGINVKLLKALEDIERTSEHVISSRSGDPMSREAVSHIANKYLDRLDHHYKGKKRLSLHSLRATYATRLCERGVSTRVVQHLLGHSDPRTTLRYAAVTEQAVLQASRVLD